MDARGREARTRAPPRKPEEPAAACGTAARSAAPPEPKAAVPKRTAHSALLRAPMQAGDAEARPDDATARRGATPHGETPLRAAARGAAARQPAGMTCRVAIAVGLGGKRRARRAGGARSGERATARAATR